MPVKMNVTRYAYRFLPYLKIAGAEFLGILLVPALVVFIGLLSAFEKDPEIAAGENGSLPFVWILSLMYPIWIGNLSKRILGHEIRLEHYVIGYILLCIVNAALLVLFDVSPHAPTAILQDAFYVWLAASAMALFMVSVMACVRTVARHYGQEI